MSVFCPVDTSAYDNIEDATLWTRITTRHTHQEMVVALNTAPAVKQTFCLTHLNVILVFTVGDEDTHTQHVRTVLQMCQDNNMKANLQACVFNAPDAEKAGFRFEKVGSGDNRALIVVDLGVPPRQRRT
ncbi:uncharacterized protein A1O5_04232 [Cladophialophora psammophila CBS 110553]|uniref:Uncharacterized protein n=1 Tax=Cladophialophora psammophila CBS 110553 TaxID=1182543 RepID=W9WYP6_9EURO|nr:uncharacterized protein A1O5_04232 [Cladophialophora psammophila CBS 110553]EXJ73083.1 hypothetical protein A1O5_04232 [Cladophialophora psammophila CBS 110553]